MTETFAREKDQILTQYILHHEVDDAQVTELPERLDRALERARQLHGDQRRKSGEPYIWHPVRTAMEVSRFGRIVDWASIEAALLHDTIEDTAYTFREISDEFPDAANLVLALTKIKDSRVHTYQKLFRYVLQDIRVLLVKLADRLDNLESLYVFKPEKQQRIARESAEMYANISRRLCMTDLADRLTDKIGPILTPEAYEAFRKAQEELKDGWRRPLEDLRAKLADLFPGDLGARIELRWNRFRPDAPPLPENLFTVRIITETTEDAYRALGRVHTAFRALPGAFVDTVSTPRKNGFRALETRVAYQGRIVSFYLASQAGDRFNRLGLLSMDITSPRFNLEYLDDLREFLRNEDMDIQDFLRFHRPDAIQVISPQGEVFSLEEGATALDFAFAIHEQLGLRAVGARINNTEASLDQVLRPGDRVEIVTAEGPVADDRYLGWAHHRKAQSALRRHLRKREAERASATGREWLLDAARAQGLTEEEAEERAESRAAAAGVAVEEQYRRICLGDEDIADVLGAASPASLRIPGGGLLRRLRGRDERRRVRRYDFDDPHIRFCPACVPVEGDEIEGVPDAGRLMVHRTGCRHAREASRIPLAWEKSGKRDLRDPGPVELAMEIEDGPGVLYSVLTPFKNQGLDVRNLHQPQGDGPLSLQIDPGTDRVLNRTLRALRRYPFVRRVRLYRGRTEPGA
ncbi:MAG: bifunctional (p)ppGpp synthetase/guanosine-3',5'-bis(diphosphate) 3'-pyrophosphohydrolase [Deferrisomatales bacterium]